MFPIQCEEIRINHLTLLLVMTCGGQMILRTSSDVFVFNLGLHFEGLFSERCILKGITSLKGVEGFNLEHWLQGYMFAQRNGHGVRMRWLPSALSAPRMWSFVCLPGQLSSRHGWPPL